jgi:hypothetical protein
MAMEEKEDLKHTTKTASSYCIFSCKVRQLRREERKPLLSGECNRV